MMMAKPQLLFSKLSSGVQYVEILTLNITKKKRCYCIKITQQNAN